MAVFADARNCRTQCQAAGRTWDLENKTLDEASWHLLAVTLADALVAAACHSLSVENTDAGDVGATHLGCMLSSNHTLLELNAAGNAVGVAGADALGLGLSSNATLGTLMLANNALGCRGVHALVHRLTAGSALHTLDLQRCQIGPAGGMALGHFLSVCH